MAKDPYATLGIARDASPEDIKRAYRKLSKEWHPDKHKGDKAAEDRFKEINEAYEVVGNAERRAQYDRFGTTGNGNGAQGGFGGFDFGGFDFGQASDLGDLFEGFFGGGRRRSASEEGASRQVRLEIDLQDALHGARKTIRLRRMVGCLVCGGSGAEPGASLISCATCGGTGQVTHQVQSFFGRIEQRTVCPTCEGRGRVPEKPCKECRGEGRRQESSDISFDIPTGIEDGQTMRLSGQGDAGQRGSASGDVLVTIRVRGDPRFRREGADIHGAATASVLDALLGGTLTIETVQGPATLQIPEGMQPGQIFRLRGKGMPVLNTSRFGDHFVTVTVEIPKKLSRAEKKVLEEWRALKNE